MEFIGWLTDWARLYKPLVGLIVEMSEEKKQWVDLCSGSGLHLKGLISGRKPVLTDKYVESISSSMLGLESKELDVLNGVFESNQFYTMFNAFHHFEDKDNKEILQKITKADSSFLFVEILRPTLFDFIKIGITTTIGQLIFAPFVKPFSWTRILFTYILPVNLFTVTFDGLVSVFKSKTASQYDQLLGNDIEINAEVQVLKTSYFSKLVIIKSKV